MSQTKPPIVHEVTHLFPECPANNCGCPFDIVFYFKNESVNEARVRAGVDGNRGIVVLEGASLAEDDGWAAMLADYEAHT